MWQHSACLGISQAEAETDNFHFICHICQRRAEDAKKPKIPALKFHLGSSSSPPSQKVKDSSIGANISKKRKSGDVIPNMPPMKKFKSVEIAQPLPNGSGPVVPLNGEDSMRQVMMNGPTLSPQGQIPSALGNGLTNPAAQPPPGLREPSERPIRSSGSAHHTELRNGYHLESTSVSLIAARLTPEAANQGTEKTSPTGWSARYSSSQTAQPSQRPQYSPVLSNPFHNSFERQRPTSSHVTYNVPSPTKNPTSSSPSHMGENGIYGQTPHTNGIPAANRLPPATPQLPSYSPIKQQSSPPMPPVQPHRQSPSSPSSHPLLHQNAPSSPGFSPTKHSPPRSFGPGEVTNTPVLPPVENLSPSPRLGNPPPPPTKVANGDTHTHM